jgi:hypothetical protein
MNPLPLKKRMSKKPPRLKKRPLPLRKKKPLQEKR